MRSPFSPGMQEHVAGRMGNVRNTCIKKRQIVYCVTQSVGHIVNPFYHNNPHARGISTAEKLRVIFGQVLFFAMIRLWPQNKNV